MEIFEAINNRRSIRSFTEDKVPDEIVEKVLNAAVMAPSAGNMQPWNFIIIRDSGTKEALSMAAGGQTALSRCQVVIAVCANEKNKRVYRDRGLNLYRYQDTAAAIQNILLAIHALSYSSVWIGAFNENEVKKVLEIPEKAKPVALIPIGKPSKIPGPDQVPIRKPLEKVVYREKFGNA